MAKKHKPSADGNLHDRIERTRREGKFQQALDLVKQLFKTQPTPQHKELLKETYLLRAAQLRTQNQMRDAVICLDAALRHDEKDLTYVTKIAQEMARCGDVQRTLALAAQLPEDTRIVIQGPLADAAILQGKTGRDALPPALQAEHDAVYKAFALTDQAKDDLARDALQAIGLRSPFLEWKLLLRGLQAFYADDDEKARENWGRLSHDRIPARLAAPFRAKLDPAYRAAQSATVQQLLDQQYNQTQGTSTDFAIRDLRLDFSTPGATSRAYRIIEQALPQLRGRSPNAVARLARVCYWGLIEAGPDAINRYRRVFGAPPDDQNFHRLQALAFQENGSFSSAHEHWQKYEKEIAAHPGAWPAGQASLARALVWLQMARNAALIPTPKQLDKLPGFARLFQRLPDPLKPSAEVCFNRGIELAPNLIEGYEGLFNYYRLQEDEPKAVLAGEKLLNVFPNHVKTLDLLASIHLKHNKADRALPLLDRALRHNPLSRDLRKQMHLAQSTQARHLTAKDEFDEARKHFQAAVSFSEQDDLCATYCQWAACELKAEDETRSEELLTLARAKSPGELLITYNLLVEANRLALPNNVKTRYTKEFNANIGGSATAPVAVSLVSFVRSLDAIDLNYHGRATHWKKIFEYALRLGISDYSEAQLDTLLGHLVYLEPPRRQLLKLIQEACYRYAKNPYFAYYELIFHMGEDPEQAEGSPWQFTNMLNNIENLASTWHKDDRLTALLDDLRIRRRALQMMNPLATLFGMGGFGFEFDEDDDDDDEYF